MIRTSRPLRIAAVTVFAVALTMTVAGPAAAAPGNEVVPVSPTDTPAQITSKAATVTPSSRQLAWQRKELTAFLHFGVNTFDDREVGDGTEDPNTFQPDALDTDQWVLALQNAGFKQAMLTAKHHDGFLLFPSKYSTFGVASSSWLGGTGDVVARFVASAHKFGMKVGIYLSPADLHEALPGGRFANGSTAAPHTIPADPTEVVGGHTFDVTADDYNTYYMNTLYEVLSRYGDVDEVWWDGANPTGRTENYDYTDWIRIVRTLQPQAVVFQDVDVRWVGNENGVARQTEWSPLPYQGDPTTAADRLIPPTTSPSAADKGSDAVLGRRNADGTSAWSFLRWSPAECDVPMTPGEWFWHADAVPRSPDELQDIYYESVGRNCVLLLDVGPDIHGRFDQPRLDALSAFGAAVRSTFGHDLASGATAANDTGTANTGGHPPNLAVDGDLDTSRQPTGSTGALVLDLGANTTFDVVGLQEDLGVGQRVRQFGVDTWDGSAWTTVANDTTVGSKKLVRLPAPVTTTRVRIRITSARSSPAIASVGLFSRSGGGGTGGEPVLSGLSGKCLDGGSATRGAPAQLWDCNGSAGQRWTVPGNGTLQVDGRCLDITGNRTANGTAVEVWDCNGGANQQWQASGGALVNPRSGRCLDDPAFNRTNGTQLVIWDCNGGANQRWTLP